MRKEKQKNTAILLNISFDKNNQNCMVFEFEGGYRNYLAIPPGKNRVDILTNNKIDSGYFFDFQGMVIVTKETERIIYFDGVEKYVQKLK